MTDQTVNQKQNLPTEPIEVASQKKKGLASKLKGFFVEEVDPTSMPSETVDTVTKKNSESIENLKEEKISDVMTKPPAVNLVSQDIVQSVQPTDATAAVPKVSLISQDVVQQVTPTETIVESPEVSLVSQETLQQNAPEITTVASEQSMTAQEPSQEVTIPEKSTEKETKNDVDEKNQSSPIPEKKADSNDKNPLQNNITYGAGINLILTQTKEEVVVEEKKFKLNLSSIFTLVIFVTVTILVFGINIAFKLSYNVQAKEIEQLEETISQDYYLLEANNKILDRLLFMKELNETNYSPRKVLNFLNDLTEEYGQILSFTLTTDLEFSLIGSTDSYESASKLWHLMVVNDDIESVTIRSISRREDEKVYVTFEGMLKYNSFVKLLEIQDAVTE
jgi:hypothetical protein